MLAKDFSILLEPVTTSATKKDISLVSGYNAYAQYIENIMKTQKGELVTDMNFGTDYFTYIFGTNDPGVLETNLSAYIAAAIPKITEVKVNLISQSNTTMDFQVFFSFYDGIKTQRNISCFVEVPL
jgi:phage baseplate assembly protein W